MMQSKGAAELAGLDKYSIRELPVIEDPLYQTDLTAWRGCENEDSEK